MPNREPQILPIPPGAQDKRAPALVIARESSYHSNVLMEGMIGQTVGSNLHLPGAQDVLDAGIAPLLGTGPFDTFQYRKHKTNAVVFEHQGVIYLYSMGSASMTNLSESENAFIELLCDVFSAYRPENVYVATFNRLLRSMDFSGKLLQAAKRDVGLLHCGTTTINPRSAEGKPMWATFAMVADMERDSIVQRLFSGQVNKYSKGEYILGSESVPPGYRLADDGTVVPVPEQRDAIRELLTMMADPDLTARQIVDAAGANGLSSATIKRIHGPDATFANLCRADSRLASLIDWMDTYRTGTAEIIHRNPFPGAIRFRDLEVEGVGPDHPGFIRFRYDWEIPEGGWAPDDVIAAAKRRTTGTKERRRGGGGTHRRRRPLSGWVHWRDAETEYRLTGTSAMYIVQAREAKPDEGSAA